LPASTVTAIRGCTPRTYHLPFAVRTTIDTITALQVARRKAPARLRSANVPETPLTQLADATLLTHAGDEVAIAATKSFTTQLTALFLFSAHLAQVRSTMNDATELALRALPKLPELIEKALETMRHARIRQAAPHIQRFHLHGTGH